MLAEDSSPVLEEPDESEVVEMRVGFKISKYAVEVSKLESEVNPTD